MRNLIYARGRSISVKKNFRLDGLIPLTIALNKKSIYKDRMLDINVE